MYHMAVSLFVPSEVSTGAQQDFQPQLGKIKTLQFLFIFSKFPQLLSLGPLGG